MAEVLQPEGQTYFSHSPLRRSPASSFLVGSPSYSPPRKPDVSYKDHAADLHSPLSSTPSPRGSPADLSQSSSFSSRSTSTCHLESDSDTDDESIAFPLYGTQTLQARQDALDLPIRLPACDNAEPPRTIEPLTSPNTEIPSVTPPPSRDSGKTSPGSPQPLADDDTALRHEPSRHVDYLSHDWTEEDIWSSWRHIVSKRRLYGERSRLENACWRTWAKHKDRLRTVSPETLNWLKDHDVTWLYGPLQPAKRSSWSRNDISEPSSHLLSRTNSFLAKKPILKKRSMSEVMLQKSLSTSSLLKQAADAVQAQQQNSEDAILPRRLALARASSDFAPPTTPSYPVSRDATDYLSSKSTSGLQTPDQGERKHIRFDDKVEQCIAVDGKDADDDEDDDDSDDGWDPSRDDDDSSDDGLVMMKKSNKQRPLSRNNSRSSFTADSKTIAKLPSTTLKYRTDSPDIIGQRQNGYISGLWGSKKLSPSPSQETLRPSNPSANFLIGDDDDEDMMWEPSGAFGDHRDSIVAARDRTTGKLATRDESPSGLRRTPSGMFMPFSDEADDEPPPAGILGRVVDTVNTAKDIAHVIWNVGWR